VVFQTLLVLWFLLTIKIFIHSFIRSFTHTLQMIWCVVVAGTYRCVTRFNVRSSVQHVGHASSSSACHAAF